MTNIKHKYFSISSCIILFLHFTISIYANSMSPYIPIDNIALNCGTSFNSKSLDGRNWLGDMGSKFGPHAQSNSTTVHRKALYQATAVEKVPFMTAQISGSQFTYTFRITAGPKFIRLYFYPALYPGFERSTAAFSIKAGPYILLSDFSPSATGAALGLNYFFKEFVVSVEENQPLNITFVPSTITSDDVYVFINGIEIVSMPTNLYYTGLQGIGVPLIGQKHLYTIDNNTSLEMFHRLNVGGNSLSPMQDSGMFRRWSYDGQYLMNPGVLPFNKSITIKYTNATPPYIAPQEIYQTGRSMGPNITENYVKNVTWILPVDMGLHYYLTRLHFCEFQPEVTRVNERVFHIYINNYTAEEQMDVIAWSGGNGIPVYRDYVVMMEPGKRYLIIALHPTVESKPFYLDAILNGVEVFKLQNYYYDDGNLVRPNPQPAIPSPITNKSKETNTTKLMFIAICGSVMVLLAILALLCCTVFLRFKKMKDHTSSSAPSWLQCWFDPYKAMSSRLKTASLPKELCRRFSLAEVGTATNNFHDSFIIGKGGFGNVYKGYIDDTMVAIKRLNPGSRQGAHEFKTEIKMLSHLRYLHLVSLIGYCNDEGEMILVYDYMINGTLRDHLYETDKDPLLWKQRLEICIGAAKGLHYLHTGAEHTIIHRDVKSSNILLDQKWVAKVSDFGLSKMCPISKANTAVSTLLKGTWGYLDPEYIKRRQLTEKSDVYSFGVVLFEVLCARKAVNHEIDDDQVCLAYWVQKCIRNRTLDKIIDPYLMGTIAPICLKKFVAIAERCLRDKGIERPTMSDVVCGLEFALQLQETDDSAYDNFEFSSGTQTEYIYEEISLDTAIATAQKDVISCELDSSTMGTSTSGQSFPKYSNSDNYVSTMNTSTQSFPSSNSDSYVKSGEVSKAIAYPNE